MLIHLGLQIALIKNRMSNVASVGATRYRHAKKLHVQETFTSSMPVIDLIFWAVAKSS